jgi:recombination associated protein RdgC
MWFNNALLYSYESDDLSILPDLLSEQAMKPCPPHARLVYGWLPAVEGEFVHSIAGADLICMGKEERLLPRGVIQRILSERIQTLETQRGYAVKRAERAQMAEDLEFELLPKSFCVQKRSFALLDTLSRRLIINTASTNQASQLTSLLRKSVPGFTIEPLPLTENLSLRFAEWITNPELLPANTQLASDCLLFLPNDDKKRFNCKGYELPAEEILTLLSQGLVVGEISLIWNERIQFTLTHELTFKRLKCLDYLMDDFSEIRKLDETYEQQDAALTLLSGELRSLFNDILNHFNTKKTPIEVKNASDEKDTIASCPF